MSNLPYCGQSIHMSSQEDWPTFETHPDRSAPNNGLTSSIRPTSSSFEHIYPSPAHRYATKTEVFLTSNAACAIGVAREPVNKLTMPSMNSPVDDLARFMNSNTMNVDVVMQTRELSDELIALLPSTFRPSQLHCTPAQLGEVVQALTKSFHAAERSVAKGAVSLQEHALHALICLSMHRLCHEGFTSLKHLVLAIALEYVRSDPDLVLAAWQKACANPMMFPNSFELIKAEATIGNLGILYAQRAVRFAGDEMLEEKLTQPLSKLPRKGMNLVMAKVVGVVYDKVCNLVAAEQFHAEVILGAFAVMQLARIGYDRELVLKAVASTDVGSLLRRPNWRRGSEQEWVQALTEEAKAERRAISEGRTVERLAVEMQSMTFY